MLAGSLLLRGVGGDGLYPRRISRLSQPTIEGGFRDKHTSVSTLTDTHRFAGLIIPHPGRTDDFINLPHLMPPGYTLLRTPSIRWVHSMFPTELASRWCRCKSVRAGGITGAVRVGE
ncbi:unnamed protein product [Protopolystoma xenopodis]|uniref:Uncharacterized protein n=1 Tax=Protopolystoma xenopodis TaxID=117903 RepID=A0A3S5CNV5_9PLAT|nr:unnamed protein product [Protopolystoma xenopodis]